MKFERLNRTYGRAKQWVERILVLLIKFSYCLPGRTLATIVFECTQQMDLIIGILLSVIILPKRNEPIKCRPSKQFRHFFITGSFPPQKVRLIDCYVTRIMCAIYFIVLVGSGRIIVVLFRKIG